MDTNRIRYFLSLARTGSITKAAELHNISAPAFSKAIKVFEREMGLDLTVPHGRGIILTDAARALVPDLEEIVRRLDAVRSSKKAESSKAAAIVRVATFEVFSTHFLERALKDGFGAHSCTVHEMIPGQMEEAVASGKVDLALTYLPVPYPELDFLKVKPIEMGIFGLRSSQTETDYLRLRFAVPVAPIQGAPNKVQGLDGWPDDAFPRNIVYRVGMMETALGLCRQGMACAYLPKFVVHLHNETVRSQFQLSEIPLPSRFPKKNDFVYLIKRKSDREGALAKRMAGMLRKFCV